MARLSTEDHDRNRTRMTYVYPVLSRRAAGVSVGVNLNTNNACNWRCIYCQVPDLTRGSAPEIDLEQLEEELTRMLADIAEGDYMDRHVPEGLRRLNDIALSGNGEPTSCGRFDEVVEAIGRVLARFELIGKTKVVLITNGSLVHRPKVRHGLARMAELGGEVWLKIDSGTSEGRLRMNDTEASDAAVRRRVAIAAELCPVRIQTCMLAIDGRAPEELELDSYLDLLRRITAEGTPIRDVLLYGLERASQQVEAPRLSKLTPDWFDALAERIRGLGIDVSVHP